MGGAAGVQPAQSASCAIWYLKTKKAKQYANLILRLFREQFDNKTQDITYKNWIDGLELIATENTKEEKEKITFTMFEPLFKAIDADKNNSINLKE